MKKRLGGDDLQCAEANNITKDEIEDWVEQYRDKVNCCQMVSKFYGGQKHVLFNYGKSSFIAFSYLLVMMTPLWAGQVLNGQGIKFRQMLVRLYNTITIEKAEAEGKLIKDFIRLVKKNPIQMQLVYGVPVGMGLLPITLSLFINYLMLEGPKINQSNYIYCLFASFSYVAGLMTYIMVIYYSSAFKSYIDSVNFAMKFFENDQNLIRCLKRILWFALILIFLSTAFAVVRVVEAMLVMSHSDMLVMLPSVVSQAVKMQASDYYQKSIVVSGHLTVVMMPLVAGRLVTNHGLKIHRILARLLNTLDTDSNRNETKLVKDFIRLIKKNRLQINLLSNVTSGLTALPIIIMFFINYLIVLLQFNHVLRLFLIFTIYVSVIVVPLIAGQMVTNQRWSLLRVVARLYNTMQDSNETEVKAVKDFIRLMKKYPLEIKLFSKISSGTSLLPAVLMLAVNYFIVLLQFNHVI
ncbi:hypothetical protein HW555_008854 [Spodoptera exigua]|uniref:Gustatory receptor n=1 Tax=Spodoptera exigua TaxID=7107 RepID=A0A835L1B7_SPOEX|nr:hypothetical protein HW555_008854 [Spodoptera exigua]